MRQTSFLSDKIKLILSDTFHNTENATVPQTPKAY